MTGALPLAPSNRRGTNPRPRARPPRRAHTLVELIIAAAITSLIMVGLASALLLAARATPVDQPAGQAVPGATAAVAELLDELRTATAVSERTPTAITFVIPDRNADGFPERVRYAWSGVAGDPLTRGCNAAAAQPVLAALHGFALGYTTVDRPETYAGPALAGSEQDLSGFSSLLNLKEWPLKPAEWLAQFVKPSLPANAVGWQISKARLRLKYDGPVTETVAVEVRRATARGPAADTLQQVLVPESTLSYFFKDIVVQFPAPVMLRADEAAFLVVRTPNTAGVAGKVQYCERDTSDGLFETKDSGATWKARSGQSLPYGCAGSICTAGAAHDITRSFLCAVDLRLELGAAPDQAVHAATALANTPELLAGLWQTDFLVDPTAQDLNGDGQPDWACSGSGVFDLDALASGVWVIDDVLHTAPGNDFTQPTIAEVRLRSTSVGGVGTVLMLPVDYHDGRAALLGVAARLQPDGTQSLSLGTGTGGSPVWLATFHGFSSGFLEARLLIDPSANLVNLVLNGRDRGTYAYTRASYTGESTGSLCALGSTGEIDRVSIRTRSP